ncbi:MULTISPECIES: DUF86 domain-containing protein [unclassified Sporosarcina]|uniref:HepT-like ribonuclease domain-containing protein n=1 Tax=unclassified Sporosarcina TaxID=2647733 RepID=UPI00203C8027|nr:MULTISPECIES: DUF86 domain-containing protein [unclassified Sporosarcina]GKV67048.1 DUF86 domain-containing protein [Sporosarcina sp. NCCP-2331]GLB57378.1 DUF86 domain-containing protein [Sporosarcina sp. NCCP-2378]
MQREPKVYLEDILSAAYKMEKFTDGLSYDDFVKDDLIFDAVIKNILVIGEATKSIPEDIRKTYSEVEWRKMAGMRDMMIHGYFTINNQIVWDVIQQ